MLTAKAAPDQEKPQIAQILNDVPLVNKRTTLSIIIDRVAVGKWYKMDVRLKLTTRQFLDPR
jgi:hypothetical protein